MLFRILHLISLAPGRGISRAGRTGSALSLIHISFAEEEAGGVEVGEVVHVFFLLFVSMVQVSGEFLKPGF